jgi:integrase
VSVEGAGRAKTPRRSFQSEEVTTLFGSDIFLQPKLLLHRKTKVSDLTLYWLFLIGVTSGARLEEIGQAHVADIRRRDGVLHIDIDVYVANDGTSDQIQGKSIKNDDSRRLVPIHDRVMEIGFERYVYGLRNAGLPLLFPDLAPNGFFERYVYGLRNAGLPLLFPDLAPNGFSKVTQEASRRANRLIDAVVTDDPRLVFHSFRHTFKDVGREADIQERILDQLCGHSPTSVGGAYGSGVGLPSLKRNLDKLAFDAVDWNAIVTAAAFIDWDDVIGKLKARVTDS